MAYQLIVEAQGVRCVFGEDFSDAMLSANRDIVEHPDFSDFRYQLIDVSAVLRFSIDSRVIEKIAKMDAEAFHRNPGMKVAVVAPQKVMLGLTKMYEFFSASAGGGQSWPSQVFETEAEAQAWINASP